MEAEQARIQADLRGILDGEVFCDPLHSQMYASDASLYQIAPIAVVRPRHGDDVSNCIKYAVENALPVFREEGEQALRANRLVQASCWIFRGSCDDCSISTSMRTWFVSNQE